MTASWRVPVSLCQCLGESTSCASASRASAVILRQDSGPGRNQQAGVHALCIRAVARVALFFPKATQSQIQVLFQPSLVFLREDVPPRLRLSSPLRVRRALQMAGRWSEWSFRAPCRRQALRRARCEPARTISGSCSRGRVGNRRSFVFLNAMSRRRPCDSTCARTLPSQRRACREGRVEPG